MSLIDIIKSTNLFSSVGVKRYIAAVVLVAIELCKVIPGADIAINTLNTIAGFFGITGTAHAALEETLGEARLATLASFVGIIIFAASWVPALQPFLPVLQQLAAILGAASIGAIFTKKQVLAELDATKA